PCMPRMVLILTWPFSSFWPCRTQLGLGVFQAGVFGELCSDGGGAFRSGLDIGSAKRLCQEPGAGHGRGDECADVPMEQRAGRRLHQQVETIETADVRTGRNRAAETTIPGDGTLRDGRKKPHPCVSASR